MNTPLAEMFRYNKWANLELLSACATLSESQLDHRTPEASGSVRELLLHIVGGQQTSVLRTHGRQHEGELNRVSPWPGFDVLTALAEHSSDELIRIAEALDEDVEVALPWQGARYAFPTSFFLMHAIQHGTEHRTEVQLSLARIGVTTPDLDGWAYSAGAGYGRAV